MIKQRTTADKKELFDPIRRKWVLRTEEELVRQCMLQFLMEQRGIPLSHLSVEREIKVNGLSKRYDIVVFDDGGKPEIVIECKAPQVAITQSVIEQVACYNRTLHASVVGVTNGTVHRFFKINFETNQIKETSL